MKTRLGWLLAFLFTTASPLFAADVAAPISWRARTLGEALLYMVIFAVAGMVLAILGYKLLDKVTPGDLHKEIVERGLFQHCQQPERHGCGRNFQCRRRQYLDGGRRRR
jgi:hypothetical protein